MLKSKTYYCLNKLFICTLLIVCINILFFSLQSNAQSPSEKGLPFITNYSPKTYKSFPQNWSIAEDDRGIMYFGNQNLILEYDGLRWNKIKITNSVIRSMTQYKDGLIYYGGFGDLGYLDYDSLGQRKTNSLLDLVPEANRNFLDIWSAYSTESGIYFQAREYLFRLNDTKPGTNEKRTIKVWTPKTKFMYSFYLDNNFYVHQQGLGLYKMVKDSLMLIPGSEFLGKERMQVMLPYSSPEGGGREGADKQYLIGMFYSGLYLFNGTTFQPFATKADPIIKSGSILYKGLLLKNGNYVLSTTGKGLVIIDAQGNLLQKINRDVGLQDESIYASYQDKKGILWLGLDNGISRVETSSPLTQFTLQSGINTGVLNIKRFEGNLYIGTTNGLLVYNNKTSFFDPVPGIPQNQIFSLQADGKQLLIPGDGLFAVKDKKTSTIKESVSADLTLSALYKSNKYPNILLGGGTFGVAVFKRPPATNFSNEPPAWQFEGYVPGITDQIWTFAENNDGTIWAGTQSGPVYKITPAFNEKGDLDLSKIKFDKYGVENGYKDGTGQVYSIKGRNYFFADSSLYTFNDKQKRFIPDSTFGNFKNGGGKTEYEMVEDQQGRVWIRFGKDTRLAIPKPEGGYRFDDSQLSTIKELTIQKIYPESTGIVWVCTTDGLIRYDENPEKNVEQPYKTVIRFATAGKNILSTAISPGSKPFSVSYKNNTLRFEYAAPFFEQEDRTQYQTWLEGFEKGWSDFDNNYYKEYTNLPTGDYHFHVRAKNIYQKISEEAVYHFSIYPPWYATWWAYTLYVLAAVVIVYFIIRWRTHQLHEKHRELEKIVADRTVQLSQRVEELAVINSVQEGLVREMDMQGIYELVGEKMREIFKAQVIDIFTYDKNTNLIMDHYSYEKGDRTLVGPREPYGFRKHVIQTKQLILNNENVEQAMKDFNNPILIGEMPKSQIYVPMMAGGEVTGIISLQNLDHEKAFSDSDVNLLTTLCNSMSVALESARLFDETNRLLKETEHRTAELAVINSVQEGLVREMNTKAIYTLVGNRICELFDTQTLIIRTFDHETGLEHYHYAIERGSPLNIDPRPIIWANKKLIETKQSLLINKNYAETAKKFGGTGVGKGLPPKSALFVPMFVGDLVKGSVSLQNVDREDAFTEADLRLLTTLTNSMSVALENARLFDETTHLLAEAKQRASELSTVNSISKALASQLDSDDLIKMVGDQLKDLFKANVVYLALLNKETGIIHFPYQYGDELASIKLGEGLTSKIIQKGEPLLINKDLNELRAGMGIKQIGVPAASYLGVPIPVGNENIGVMSVQSIEQENRFNENDLRLLSTIASSVGVALNNATLFEDVKLAKMEAEIASKLAEKANETKSAFLSTVSHELRTPLTSVLGFAKIIKKRLEEKIFPLIDKSDAKIGKVVGQVSENLHVVISEGERLTHLINDVLDLAKIEAGKMDFAHDSISMPEIAERAIAATTSLFEQKALKLIKQIEPNLPDVIGDKDKLIQVVINLISNSVKFTDTGSITCSIFSEKDELIVSIRDTGIGIAPQDFGAVFEQFKQVGGDTLTDKPKGTGLGLPICKEIVEHLGGRIWLESEIGKGSTFSFALPIVKTAESRPIHLDDLVKQLKEQVAHSQLNAIGQSANILIVDDDDSIRSLLHQELGDAGYHITEARNGKEALKMVRAHRPDLIILDIMMPEMNGFDVAAVLKNDPETMDIPIIVLSVVLDKARGFRIGVDRYLTKPIDTALLFTEIGSLLEQGKSKKKVMIVDDDTGAVNTLTEVLKTKGYTVFQSNEKELVEKAIANPPDIIFISSVLSGNQDIVKTLRFEKGLERVVFMVYQ